ncbi:sigma-54-dependent transcriptional regulator [Desulfogranum mediterraneum]|uniref:sigma-54-dependent transcriptional regulator n=1 Tax=Desulfogranum mediterraneum TaxID=160661 RepID=UPI000403CD8A|nr:sigma-54 dependent transcriptional regulator [Desulfogranum mediterraneum]
MKGQYPRQPILLVDDESAWLHSFRLSLCSAGMNHVITSDDPRTAIELIGEHRCPVVVLDLNMPYLAGEELLPQIVEQYPGVAAIVVTGLDTVEAAVSCMKQGAYDFYTKVSEEQRLINGVRRAVEVAELRSENAALKTGFFSQELFCPEAFSEIITHNRQLHTIFQYMEAIASTSEPVLISGETGVGKELFARAVHRLSGRRGKFVAINISGYDETLLSDTLFGHKRGAYSGADTSRQGLVSQAADGTLFLDEIGDLNQVAQVKLLRLIQEREYYPLGSDTARSTSARMIFATHQDLEQLQQTGAFRQDLFYRLCTHQIHIPPLRERLDDLHLLLEHFLAVAAKKLAKPQPAYPTELPILLGTYDYPGNVRELEAMIFNALSKHQSHTLSMDEFKHYICQRNSSRSMVQQESPPEMGLFSDVHPLPTLKQGSELLITEALSRAQGNQAIAAQMLGITRQALNWRLKQAGSQSKKVA